MTKHEQLSFEKKERMKHWITFWRRNPHRFVETYFGIKLYPYQYLMLYVLQKSNLAYIVASRATAKTYMIAIWAVTLCVLYPGIKVVICSKTLKQGGLIVSEKIAGLIKTYPNVAREIQTWTANQNNYNVIFHCGSTITVVPSSENSRGARANYIIVEESRLVPKDILEGVIRPFLSSRIPPYRSLAPYDTDDNLLEESTISFITSAGFKHEYWYNNYVKPCIRRMVNGDPTANFLAFDYLICLRHNIKTSATMKSEMADADAMTVQMEYLNIPSGVSGQGYYRPKFFKRTIKRAFYPQKVDTYDKKKNPYGIPKVDGEIRMVSIDVASRANRDSDLSIISCVRLIPELGRGYQRMLMYMESSKGENVIKQANRIKQIFHDFEGDYIVLDLRQIGVGIFDAMSGVTHDEERGIEYPPLTIVDEHFAFIDQKVRDDLRARTTGINANPVVFPILATQGLNSEIAVSFRASLQKGLWSFLIPDTEAEEFLTRNLKEFTSDANDSALYAFFMNPYVQTGLFIGECLNLDMTIASGNIKLSEKQGAHKDRFTSVSYCNWVVSHFDLDLLRELDDYSADAEVLGVTMVF
jgi:hypothetical protein